VMDQYFSPGMGSGARDVCLSWKTTPHVTIARLEAAYPVISKPRDFGSIRREGLADLLIDNMTIDPIWAEGVRPVTNGEILKAFMIMQRNVETSEKAKRGKRPSINDSDEEWEKKMREPFQGQRFGRDEHVTITRNDLMLPDAVLIKIMPTT